MRWLPVLLVAVAGCASAKVDNGNGGPADGNTSDDGNATPQDAAVDAVPIDSAPVAIQLSQTTVTTIVAQRSIACSQNPGSLTLENSYYRVFAPADHGITGPLHVTKVTFGIELANGPGGVVAAQVKVGTYANAVGGTSIDLNQITPITAMNVNIPNGSGTMFPLNITADIPTGKNLIIELAIPDGTGSGTQFFIGTNGGGESRPGYMRGPVCGLPSPVTMKSVAAVHQPPLAEPDMVILVDGTH